MQPPPATANVRVRRAEASDLDDLVSLEQRTFDSDRLSRAQYRRHLDSDSARVLVASADHRHFLGSAVLFFRKGSAVARLYSLATQPDARGKGIGTALVEAVEAAAHRRRCRMLRLEVRADNTAAIALYERQGYRRTGFLEGYYEDGADGWRYEKPLAPGQGASLTRPATARFSAA
ncbi:MAG: GNAT family N-acetyltransferase [Xanthomonadaceae bacterium]|nr:GNAT family N-acetyltransferase [Xanthomonadaceae bacterium]MDE3072728.1 GNAT family N-acetyltransferase [Pseudomonadota bacterium]